MKNKTKENIGFVAEVLCFFLSGVLLFRQPLLSIGIFMLGIFLAIKVGDLIKINALEFVN